MAAAVLLKQEMGCGVCVSLRGHSLTLTYFCYLLPILCYFNTTTSTAAVVATLVPIVYIVTHIASHGKSSLC